MFYLVGARFQFSKDQDGGDKLGVKIAPVDPEFSPRSPLYQIDQFPRADSLSQTANPSRTLIVSGDSQGPRVGKIPSAEFYKIDRRLGRKDRIPPLVDRGTIPAKERRPVAMLPPLQGNVEAGF